jgi:hypothetical protein
MPKEVFISYSSKDGELARKICTLLEKEGLDCWIAPRDVRPFYEYDEEVIDAIDEAAAMILVLSKHSNESVHVKHEVEHATSRRRPVCTVRIQDVLPSKGLALHTSTRHWVDAWAPPLEGTVKLVATEIRGLIGSCPGEPKVQPLGASATPKPLLRPPKLWPIAAAAVVLIAVLGWGWGLRLGLRRLFEKPDVLRPQPLGPERTLTYRLTIKRQSDGQEIPATGLEMFATGYRFRFKATPEEAGALYLINEGPNTNGNGGWHTLFPTPANNQGDARLAARQPIETREYEFTGANGMERIWIVWATQPVPLLDEIIKQSINTDLTIRNPSELRKFLEAHRTPEPKVVIDKEQSLVTLKGSSAVYVYLLELRHTEQ